LFLIFTISIVYELIGKSSRRCAMKRKHPAPTGEALGFSDLLDATFSLYRTHFRVFFPIAGVYYVSALGMDMLIVFLVEDLNAKVSNLLTYVLRCFFFTGFIVASIDTYLGRQITGRAALHRVLHRFLPCFYGWLFLLFANSVSTTFIRSVYAAVLFSYLNSNINGLVSDPLWMVDPARQVAMIVVSLIFSLFALYFLIRWLFYGMSVLFEEATARTALRRSSELVYGSWWRVFGIATAMYLLAEMLAVILVGVCVSPFLVTGLIEEGFSLEMISRSFSSSPSEVGWLVYVILQLMLRCVVALTILPLLAIGLTRLYFDMRIRKEGFDFQMQTPHRENI